MRYGGIKQKRSTQSSLTCCTVAAWLLTHSVTSSSAACVNLLHRRRWHCACNATPSTRHTSHAPYTASNCLACRPLICNHSIWLQISITALNDALSLPLALPGHSSVDALPASHLAGTGARHCLSISIIATGHVDFLTLLNAFD